MSHMHIALCSPSHRGMPGVMSNPNGTCCAGHCQALNDNPDDEKTKKKKARNLPELGAMALVAPLLLPLVLMPIALLSASVASVRAAAATATVTAASAAVTAEEAATTAAAAGHCALVRFQTCKLFRH